MDKRIIQKEVTTMFKMVGETTPTSRVEFSNQNQPTAKVTFVDTPQQKNGGLVKGHVIACWCFQPATSGEKTHQLRQVGSVEIPWNFYNGNLPT